MEHPRPVIPGQPSAPRRAGRARALGPAVAGLAAVTLLVLGCLAVSGVLERQGADDERRALLETSSLTAELVAQDLSSRRPAGDSLPALQALADRASAGAGARLSVVDADGRVVAVTGRAVVPQELPRDAALPALARGPRELTGPAAILDSGTERWPDVTAGATRVPGTDWFVVASRPTEVGLSSVAQRVRWVRVATGGLVLAVLVCGVLWGPTRGRRRRELVQAHERFRAVYAASPAGIVETDLEQRVLHCNAAFGELLGRDASQLIGRAFCELFHPDGPPPDRDALADLTAGRRRAVSGQRLLQHADGRPITVRVEWAAIADERGRAVQLSCVLMDLSAQVQAAAAMDRAREHAQVLFAQAPIGVVEGTLGGVVTSVNAAFADLLGYRPEELVGRPVSELLVPEQSSVVSPGLERLRSGEGYTAERTYLTKDRRRVPALVSTTVLKDADGGVERLAAFVVDLTEQHDQRQALCDALEAGHAAREEVERRKAFLDAVLETVDVGIVYVDADCQNMTRNRAEREMMFLPVDYDGGRPQEAAPLIDLLTPDGDVIDPDSYPLVRALRGEDAARTEAKLGPRGGPHRDIVIRASRIEAPSGEVLGAVVSLMDVTVEREALRELDLERARLHEAQRVGRLGGFVIDVADGSFHASGHCRALFGLTGPVTREAIRSTFLPGDLETGTRMFEAAIREGGRHTSTWVVRRQDDGERRHLRVDVEVERDGDGRPTSVTGTFQDVTELTEAERRATEANALFEAILTASPDYTFVTDVCTGAVVYGSPGKSVVGISSERLQELGPAVVAALVHPDDQVHVRAANLAAADLDDGDVLQIRYRVLGSDGTWNVLSRRVTPFRRDPATGKVVEVLGVVRDVSDVVVAEQQLHHAALHDPLTGLPNRALLMDRLTTALSSARTTGRDVVVLFIDLDGFKRVNDTAGHAAGDAVLVQAAARIRGVLRERDTVARVGGDEFVVLAEPFDRHSVTSGGRDGTEEDAAADLAGRLAAAMRPPILVDGVEHVVTASIGITLAGRGTDRRITAQDVLQDADAAMYRAKKQGKDRFEVFEHSLRTDRSERGRVEQCLRQALDAQRRGLMGGAVPSPRRSTARLHAAYQPVFDSRDGALVSFEALARLTDCDGKPISPELFISVAEETGLIHALGLVILQHACAQLAVWRTELPGMEHVTMAVNVSALQARHADLVGDVRDALSVHALRPQDLVLELTETALLQAAHSTLTALRRLHSLGVGIAIDDFGTGYASLRYLATLPVSSVKVDRSFTAGLPHDVVSSKIVQAVIGLAADLDLGCVVEGVETEAQRAALPPSVHIQGWLMGRAERAGDLDLVSLLVGSP